MTLKRVANYDSKATQVTVVTIVSLATIPPPNSQLALPSTCHAKWPGLKCLPLALDNTPSPDGYKQSTTCLIARADWAHLPIIERVVHSLKDTSEVRLLTRYMHSFTAEALVKGKKSRARPMVHIAS